MPVREVHYVVPVLGAPTLAPPTSPCDRSPLSQLHGREKEGDLPHFQYNKMFTLVVLE